MNNTVFGKLWKMWEHMWVILMNRAMYLGFWMLELSKTLIYQFRYDYVKPKYGKKANLCYTQMFKQDLTLKEFHWETIA